jgi:hypothetical protein
MEGPSEFFQGVVMAEPKLGSGGRFKALESKLSARMRHHANGNKEVHDPAALAAYIGRKKYGAAKMAKMSSAGRK